MSKYRKKMSKDPSLDEENFNQSDLTNLLLLSSQGDIPKTRIVSLYGEIEEEKSCVLINNLYILKDITKNNFDEIEDPEKEKPPPDPIKMLISTEGGAVCDMFSIYDAMRDIQKECEVHTFGLGKVMSAGLPLIAAGTKGHRRAGKYCRFMFHGISGGNHGLVHDLQNDFKEVKWIQEQYMSVLLEETKMTKSHLKRLLNKKTDIYFSAKQALEWGIIDVIV